MSFLQTPSAPHRYPYEWLDRIATSLLILATLVLPFFVLPLTRDAINLPKELCLAGIAVCALLLWLLRGILARELFVRTSALDTPVAIFLTVVTLSALLSISPSVAWLGRPGHFVLHAAAVLLFAMSSWLLVQYIRSQALWQIFTETFCVAGAIAMALSWLGFNAATELNSTFGIAAAIIATFSFGLLLERGNLGRQHVVSILTAALSVATLLRLGFQVAWIVFAVGAFFLILIGALRPRDVRMRLLSFLFFLFIAALFFGLTKTPDVFREDLPTEVSLAPAPSWDISKRALFSDARRFFVGQGPGTYVYAFSEFRPAAFNLAPAGTPRFSQPYNTLLALLPEIGAVGTAAFLFVIVAYAGLLFRHWRGAGITALAAGAAWIAATVGLGAAYYSVTLWWFWWALLAFGLTGLSFAVGGAVREKTMSLDVSPQYSLAVSFGMIMALCAALLLAVFAERRYAAERAYTHGDAVGAVALAPRSSEYRLALSHLHFEEAKALAETEDPASAETIARLLSSAVEEARLAAAYDAKNVETWETLSLLYLNARALAPDANEWSRDATNRAILLEPANAAFYWRLGNIHEYAGKDDDAVRMYRKAIELNPRSLDGYLSLSALFERRTELTEAIAVFLPILPQIQEDPELLFNAGRLFYNRNENGDADQAQALFLRAVALRPEYSNAIYSLGLIAERRGELKKAREYFERVRELNPENADIVQKLRSL